MAMGTKEAKQEKVSNSNGLVQLITNMLTQKQNMKPIGGDNGNDNNNIDTQLTNEIANFADIILSCIEIAGQNQNNTPANPNQTGTPATDASTGGNPVTAPADNSSMSINGKGQINETGEQNAQTGITLKQDAQQTAQQKGVGVKFENNVITFKYPRIKMTNPKKKWQSLYFNIVLDNAKNVTGVSLWSDIVAQARTDDFKQKVSVVNAIERAIKAYQGKVADSRFEDIASWNALPNDDKSNAINDSIQVSYSHKVLKESVATNTVITRTFKNFPRKSYVLSESYFDLGRDTSKLSNHAVAKRFKTKANVYEYVKNNLDAKIYKLTESQTYNVCSYTHNKPSLMTPLYENVYVVRFDDDDNVSSIKYLGKFKIQ